MKRTAFTATLTVDGRPAGEAVGHAFNSTVRKSEGLVREYARSLGRIFEGDRASREGNTYTRYWRSGDTVAVATVTDLQSQ